MNNVILLMFEKNINKLEQKIIFMTKFINANKIISYVSFRTKQRQVTANKPPVTSVGKLDLRKTLCIENMHSFDILFISIDNYRTTQSNILEGTEFLSGIYRTFHEGPGDSEQLDF